jgi:hypothetical protein
MGLGRIKFAEMALNWGSRAVESISDPAIRSPKRRTAAEVGHGC